LACVEVLKEMSFEYYHDQTLRFGTRSDRAWPIWEQIGVAEVLFVNDRKAIKKRITQLEGNRGSPLNGSVTL
jgi:hypothetical protein